MTYPEAIAYLHSLTDYEKTRLARYAPDVLDLSRVERLLAALGNPHTQFPSVHIAGTKGKGSTSAIIESCLRAAGHRTGFYISPHLHTFRERIQVAGVKIAREEVVSLVEELRPVVEREPGITTFEAITALGFLYFARRAVDIAVVEVGLGGRLDATNVLLPEVCAITSISLDHTYLLGDTLAQIAAEKAGIIKPGVPVVSAPQHPEAGAVIEATALARQAPLTQVGRDWCFEGGPADLDGQQFSIRRNDGAVSDLEGEYWLPLLGRHQLENAATAVATLATLRARGATPKAPNGFTVPAEAVHAGLRTVSWPGRMELLSREPPVVVDCAHNPYSVEVLCAALAEWFPGRRWTLIFGASSDKDIIGMLRLLVPISDYVIVTRSDHPRSAAPADLADMVASLNGDRHSGAEIAVNVKKALRRGLAVLREGGGLLVTGSIFVVADAREEWALYSGRPALDNDNP